MQQSFIHTCPYCGTHLSITKLPTEKIASRCPKCNKYLIVDNFGQDVRIPNVYTCPRCNEEHIYDGRPPLIKCNKCGNVYITSNCGVGMIDLHILSHGDNGELSYNKKKDRLIDAINKWLSFSQATKIGILATISIFIFFFIWIYISSLPSPIETSKAYAQMDSLWNEFSEKNPYNIQIECIKEFDDNSKIVLISEPSEFVSEEELTKYFEPYNSFVKTYKRKIGFDGYMRDFLVAFNNLDEEEYNSFVKKLSILLYKTDYKANLIDISTMISHTPYLDYNVNYNVTSEELREWFISKSEEIRPLEGDTSNVTNIATILNENIENGMQLYTSVIPGFIIWIIDKSKYIGENIFRINSRKFSLDSDLILGAISSGTNVAIIARERCIPITQLPPMRPETLCLLAYTREEELSQSYERNNLFAGKLTGSVSGGKDFAPILLSDALWHTEYGNMLNVTDQMLKSWSENGLIDYVDFNYPKPVFWCFNRGILTDLGVSTLTYNWNTEGVGYIVDDNLYSIYALNRTGSLPVSYIPGDATQTSETDPIYQAEQNAYDFFSSLANPELAKVVQYAAMYQIFQNFNIHMHYTTSPNYNEFKAVIPPELENEAANMLLKLARFNNEDRNKIAQHYNASITTDDTGLKINENYGIISNNKKLPTNPLALAFLAYFIEEIDSLEAIDVNNLFHASNLIAELDTIHESLELVIDDKKFIASLGKALIDKNKIMDIVYTESSSNSFDSNQFDNLFSKLSDLKLSNSSKEKRVDHAFNTTFSKMQYLKYFTKIFSSYDCNEAKALLVKANNNRNRTWMKTPTIVESWSIKDSTSTEGGHNLNSNVTHFRVADDLKPGQIRETTINGKKTIEVSILDSKSHITNQFYLRKVGRLNDATIKGNIVKIRSRDIVTDIASERTSRGFNTRDHSIIIGKNSFNFAGKEYTRLDALINDFCKLSTPDEILNIRIECHNGSGVQPKMIINNINCRLRRGNTHLPISKFDFSHATQSTEGNYTLFKVPIKPGKIILGSTSLTNRAGLGGSSNIGTPMHLQEGACEFKILNKSKTAQIINVLKDFFSRTKEYFNEFKLRKLLKQHGIEMGRDIEWSLKMNINREGITEKENITIAFIKQYKSHQYDIQLLEKKEIA